MPAPMWRMNGLSRGMAGVLVLCVLLLSSEVMCQDDPATDATVTPTTTPKADSSTANSLTESSAGRSLAPNDTAGIDTGADRSGGFNGVSTASPATGDGTTPLNTNIDSIPDNQDGGTSDISESTAVSHVPDVKCVGKEDISESNAVKAVVKTADCEETKGIIQKSSTHLCHNCNLTIFQEGNTVLMASDNAKLSALAKALQTGHFKDKLGVTNTETPPSSGGSSVFVGILVSGLLAALAITVGYLKCPRRSNTKGVKLAEEAYPVDQENQGNTLVSVAPLSTPPETQEKPSVNGESLEAAKDQPPPSPPPPPTNGHSTTKTADTEL